MESKTLKSLVLRAQNGDREAVEELLAQFRQPVFALCVSFLKERQAAEEAAQEVFIRVFCRLSSLKKPQGFRSWCLTIAANYCRDRLKSRSLKTVPLEHAPETESPQADHSPIEPRFQQALDSLNPNLKQALILREVENFSYQEISSIQKTALGTVKSRIYEAKKKLRKYLSPCIAKK